jgi:hypothetical protein
MNKASSNLVEAFLYRIYIEIDDLNQLGRQTPPRGRPETTMPLPGN